MTRITNDLFEAIRKVTAGQQEQQVLNEEAKEKEEKGEKKHKEGKEEMDEGQVDKAHYCATHVEHSLFGKGVCVKEAHADPDVDGNISWYTVQFLSGTRKVDTDQLNIIQAESHMHSKKKPMKEDEEVEQTNEAKMSPQAKTTMKHISNPTPGEKKAAKDIKPGIAGYRDRVAMLKSAEARGALKEDEVTEGKGDGNLANNYPPYDKVTRGDVVSGRLGKDHKGGKNKAAMMKESVPFTFVVENEFTVEIPTNLSYADYLDAVKTVIGSDDPEYQQDIVNIAAEAFDLGKVEIIAEAILIKQGVFEAYNRTREGDKMHSPELGMDIDRSNPGRTIVKKKLTNLGGGETRPEAKMRRAADKVRKQNRQ